MAKITTVVYNYNFSKPTLMTEDEFNSYKQIFELEPNYDFNPKMNFWDQFSFTKWILLTIFGGAFFSIFWAGFLLVSALALATLFLDMLSGTLQSMMNYQKIINKKNEYFKNLKLSIITSQNYDEFKIRMQS